MGDRDLSNAEIFSTDDESKPSDPSDVVLSEITQYGNGDWFWPKSNQFYSPKFPLASLKPSQDTLLDHLVFLAFANKSWKIRAAIPYLFKACRGKISERTIWGVLKQFEKMGVVQCRGYSFKRANSYLINPICMRRADAMKMSHYEQASQLVLKTAPAKTLETQTQKRHMSRQAQLNYAKRQLEKDLTPPGPENLCQ